MRNSGARGEKRDILYDLGAIAIKAGNGQEWAARRYYILKIVHLCFSALSLSPWAIVLTGYFTVVARSLWVLILEDKLPAPLTVVVFPVSSAPSAPPSYEAAVAKTLATDTPDATTSPFHADDQA